MAGEIESRSGLFHQHQLLDGELRNIRQRCLLFCAALGASSHGKEVHLSLYIVSPHCRDGIHDLLIYLDQLGPAGSQRVKGSGADQVLHRPLVHVAALHPLAEVIQRGEGALFPLAHHGLDKASAAILNRH